MEVFIAKPYPAYYIVINNRLCHTDPDFRAFYTIPNNLLQWPLYDTCNFAKVMLIGKPFVENLSIIKQVMCNIKVDRGTGLSEKKMNTLSDRNTIKLLYL